MIQLQLSYAGLLMTALTVMLLPQLSIAQDHVFGSWTAWFNNVRFNDKWGMNNDIQFRGGRDWTTNSLLLIRPGVNYYVNNRQTASLGYATTFVTNELPANGRRITEHRIWQQYIINGKVLGIPIQHRFRFEQRFLRRPDETAFAQRARYFFRSVVPVNQPLQEPFHRGLFISLQNELFFNIHNNKAVNNRLFDQNRAYTSLGFRFSEKYDLETGYMNQFLLRDSTPDTMTHIFQVALYTRL
ncbi:DUF2490 domain-containing protein [Parapedobacter sp. ISTM3]|uniref:DUF2490 domain-containing protein n=1 Tax=Parapedobacter sp. ISTM3 TaxID=2800130 RepID=UPI001904CB87|nr:DUF2490 domain-containing protein [Parapedobacter sp. ISTM3]MBK1442476.1 DUF2490 domain-containing protein [Parapedobacter sp. ISTM3]